MPTNRDIVAVLREHFGHTSFRDGQEEIIDHVLAGKHALVLMPTGGGKSLCYQVPALMLDGLTLVISPLIALMKDQVDALKRKDIDAEFVNSSISKHERERRYQAIRDGTYRLLYVTPERFRKQEFLDVIATRAVSLMAVDEAHCISEWGHDFRPDYTRLNEIREFVGNPTTVALTATATPDVQVDIVKRLGLTPDAIRTFHHGIERPNLVLEVRDVHGMDEKLEAIQEIREARPGSGIVYFALIKTLEQYSEQLKKRGVPHCCYFGTLERDVRRHIQDAFMSGEEPLVLATNAFGMGIDKEDIRFVIHAEVPGSMESYYQEIGRAGRDGEPSTCCLLYDQRDLEIQMQFIKWCNPNADYYHQIYHLLEEQIEAANAFGLEWVRQQMHHKNRSDRRPETALSMLARYGAIEGDLERKDLNVVAELPKQLLDQQRLADKLMRDQKKLLAIVEYTKLENGRKAYIAEYFGVGE